MFLLHVLRPSAQSPFVKCRPYSIHLINQTVFQFQCWSSRNRSYKFSPSLKFKLRKAKPKSMPDESCRTCGGTLINYSLCAECKEVIGMICVRCGTRTPDQFHDSCLYLNERMQTITELNRSVNPIPKIVSIS